MRSREHLKRYPLDLYLGPTIPPPGLASRDDDDGGDGDDGVLTSKYVLLLTKVMIMTI